ncbi:MAG TPA: hypothetical protein VNW29_04925 [Candidatus Sulfotelmatobacter sp.]|jgi:hypothetical protein|nr:hypothetical protein [Candidatus Sulfotelmatobacter sp.]
MNRMSPEGIFIAGATGTAYATRALVAEFEKAYAKAKFIGSSLLSPDPPPRQGLSDLLQEKSGYPVHIYVHSSGGAQLRRAIQQVGRGHVDMKGMTIVPIDIPKGPGNLMRGMMAVNGKGTRAVDSVTAFPPDSDIISLNEATEGLRHVFSGLVNNGRGLRTIDYQLVEPVNYSETLSSSQQKDLTLLDRKIADTLSSNNLSIARVLFSQRGVLVREAIESIYHGNNRLLPEANPKRGEVAQNGSVRTIWESARILPAVASGKAWRLMREFQEQHEAGWGPRVVAIIPEYGQYVSPADAQVLYQSSDNASLYLPNLSHSGIALQPSILREMRAQIESM